MSKLIQKKQIDLVTTRTNEQCICMPDNITITPVYHIHDSMSYHIVRCNYCEEEWAEYWTSYRHMVSSLIDHGQERPA